jgi:hypothetical protein
LFDLLHADKSIRAHKQVKKVIISFMTSTPHKMSASRLNLTRAEHEAFKLKNPENDERDAIGRAGQITVMHAFSQAHQVISIS